MHAHTHTGAVNGQVGEDDVTHLVVADGVGPETVPVTHPRVLVVKQQWFWESIQIEASADEGLYSIKVSLCYKIHEMYRVIQNISVLYAINLDTKTSVLLLIV